jgi:hypothetical protein
MGKSLTMMNLSFPISKTRRLEGLMAPKHGRIPELPGQDIHNALQGATPGLLIRISKCKLRDLSS